MSDQSVDYVGFEQKGVRFKFSYIALSVTVPSLVER